MASLSDMHAQEESARRQNRTSGLRDAGTDRRQRYRGKKRSAPAPAATAAEPDSKRPKTDAELAYAREVAELRRHSELKDRGSGAAWRTIEPI